MKLEDLKALLIECFKDTEVKETISNELVNPIVQRAVKEAVATRDEEIRVLKKELNRTQVQVNELEQYSRRECVLLSGIHETEGEDTDQVVVEVGRAMGVEIKKGDLARTHRIGRSEAGKVRRIIAKFNTFRKRQEFYLARRNLRNQAAGRRCGLPREVIDNVYISDSLTRYNESVMFNARKLRREGKIFAAWTDLGRVKVRLVQSGPTKVISCQEDLDKLVDDATVPHAPSAGAGTAEYAPVTGAAVGDRGSTAPGRPGGLAAPTGGARPRDYASVTRAGKRRGE